MSAQAQMRALLDQLMGTARDGESGRPCLPSMCLVNVAVGDLAFMVPLKSRVSILM
uniref:LUC7 like n=1 Tax=Suricata suricatta TaxID=37032 RepID=A0A673TTX7_SURSU